MRIRAPARSSRPEAVITEKTPGQEDGGLDGRSESGLRRLMNPEENCHAGSLTGRCKSFSGTVGPRCKTVRQDTGARLPGFGATTREVR
ncbi:hypothetical protein GCM10010211_68290 [Streptomyces albospinus]|uniref:Uncharacterized protein n=1 Tax=Streptomyces albospinus TaxID=285515 RepID=A0ABQ2VK72_9ACTN|nr:hypothetical protein GCM10010211_68290 [Streptomyces albospinus]